LDSLVHGPYEVVENDSHTFRLRMGSDVVRISYDRIKPAPGKPRTTPQGGDGGKEESVVVPRAAGPPTQEPAGVARKTQGKRNERELPCGVSGQTGKRGYPRSWTRVPPGVPRSISSTAWWMRDVTQKGGRSTECDG
jgi:hypothetical protein